MEIVVIGSGNVATHLTLGLFKKGVKIKAVISKNLENAAALGDQVNAPSFDNMKKYADWGNEQFVLIAVKDDAILEVISSGLLRTSAVVHTSGSFDSAIMATYCGTYGAFYPFQTFRKTATVDLHEVPFFLELSDVDQYTQLERLAKLLSESVLPLNSFERKKLHLSGVFVNNFIYFILDKTKNICIDNNIPQKVLKPLLDQTIKYALDYPENLQTGPAQRGDVETMKGHLKVLEDKPYLAEIYKTMSYLIYNESHDKEIEL